MQENFPNAQKAESIWDFQFSFPSIEEDNIVSLDEGGTPCEPSKKLGKILGIEQLYFKNETKNPTNSFKDRPASLLISHARSWDFQKVICASNGNQGASIAAYTSIEAMECLNFIPEKIDIGKKAQIIAYDSKVITQGETVDDCIQEALNPKYSKDYYQATPEFNPLTLEAEKTIAFEIFLELGVPEWIIVPMGSGGLLVSIWKGFSELKDAGLAKEMPRFIGAQTKFSSSIVDEFLQSEKIGGGEDKISDSIALGILVKDPLYKKLAIKAIKETNGTSISVSESNILSSVEELLNNEGIFAEPSSALTVAALNILGKRGIFDLEKDKIVCIITGSGLKAPYVLEALSSRTKTAGMGSILSTKLKILSQISMAQQKGINGTQLKKIIGSISRAAIYQHLKDLESKDLINRRKEGKNVFYFITNDGKKVLDALDTLIALL